MLLADPAFFAPYAGFLGRYLFGDDKDNTTRTEFDHHSNHEDKIDGNRTPEADVPAKGLHDMKTNDDGAKTPTATDNMAEFHHDPNNDANTNDDDKAPTGTANTAEVQHHPNDEVKTDGNPVPSEADVPVKGPFPFSHDAIPSGLLNSIALGIAEGTQGGAPMFN